MVYTSPSRLLMSNLPGNPAKTTQASFAVSAGVESMNRATIMKNGEWFGDRKYGPVTVIDTPGLGDSAGKPVFRFFLLSYL
jgi:hypothetical protein